jgi:hypothetical protein
MTWRIPTIVVLLLSAMACGGAWAEDAPSLQHNPFARPQSDIPLLMADPLNSDRVPPGEILLTAVMVSSGDRLAHVNGVVMRPGDEVYGNKLLRVHEDRVVFSKDGEESTVYVKPELNEDDEETSNNRRRR